MFRLPYMALIETWFSGYVLGIYKELLNLQMYVKQVYGMMRVRLTATVTCNQYYLLSCGVDGAR